jgi:hypothetical protein
MMGLVALQGPELIHDFLSCHVMPSAILQCSKKVFTRCQCHALGTPSLQNYEPNKILFFINYWLSDI